MTLRSRVSLWWSDPLVRIFAVVIGIPTLLATMLVVWVLLHISGPPSDRYTYERVGAQSFAKIQSGMMRTDVETLLGPGRVVSQTNIDGTTYTTEQWAGDRGGTLMVTFRGHVVDHASQFGLAQ